VKQQDVPQEKGLLAGTREVAYAIDANGCYKLEHSLGWSAKDIALRQAWKAIEEQVGDVIDEIKAGRKSPLAYHMVNNQMDETLLAQYSGIARWRVKRHLKPFVFNKLNRATLHLYSRVFNISIEELALVPDNPTPHLSLFESSEANPS
jgi:hypothetical protein